MDEGVGVCAMQWGCVVCEDGVVAWGGSWSAGGMVGEGGCGCVVLRWSVWGFRGGRVGLEGGWWGLEGEWWCLKENGGVWKENGGVWKGKGGV